MLVLTVQTHHSPYRSRLEGLTTIQFHGKPSTMDPQNINKTAVNGSQIHYPMHDMQWNNWKSILGALVRGSACRQHTLNHLCCMQMHTKICLVCRVQGSSGRLL